MVPPGHFAGASYRRTVTIHREISARRSLMPAGDGSKLFSDTLVPDKSVREGDVGP